MSEELYQEAILESARSTAHRGDLKGRASALNILVHNPLCGDQVHLWMECDGDCIHCARFSGHGCSISHPAAAMVCAAVDGRSPQEAAALVDDFKQLLSGAADEAAKSRLGEIVSLEGVRRFPARARCASIAFEALASLLRKESGKVVTTEC